MERAGDSGTRFLADLCQSQCALNPLFADSTIHNRIHFLNVSRCESYEADFANAVCRNLRGDAGVSTVAPGCFPQYADATSDAAAAS